MQTSIGARALLCFSLLAIPLSLHDLHAQEEVGAGPAQAVVTRAANLRERANVSSRSLAILPQGTSVAVVGAYQGWRRVRTDNRTGWIAGDLLDAAAQPESGPEAMRATAELSIGCTAQELDDCPETGCASNSEEELLHTRKRRRVTARPIPLSMQDFLDLQAEAEQTVGQGATVFAEDMTTLRRLLRRGNGHLGEGKAVEFFGYVVGEPKGSGAENVNCNLGTPDVDFHINVADGPNRAPFKSIVVEMIPQGRPGEWTTAKLRRIQREDLPVRVVGQLFYDNKHFVRDGRPQNERSNQSKRHSLWEIHPVTKFQVCPDGDCTPTDREGWVRLEDWPG